MGKVKEYSQMYYIKSKNKYSTKVQKHYLQQKKWDTKFTWYTISFN